MVWLLKHPATLAYRLRGNFYFYVLLFVAKGKIMKKDVYFIVGILTLVLTASIGAWYYYKKTEAKKYAVLMESAELQEKRLDLALLRGDGKSVSQGPEMARIQLVEWLDPECESCRAMHPFVKEILKSYGSSIHYTLRYMPFHQNSTFAAALLEGAREQDKYWEALEVAFLKQPEWGAHHEPKPELLVNYLVNLGLNREKLLAATKNQEILDRIKKDQADGSSAGVTGTPTFFVNGRMLRELGPQPLRALIDEELKGATK